MRGRKPLSAKQPRSGLNSYGVPIYQSYAIPRAALPLRLRSGGLHGVIHICLLRRQPCPLRRGKQGKQGKQGIFVAHNLSTAGIQNKKGERCSPFCFYGLQIRQDGGYFTFLPLPEYPTLSRCNALVAGCFSGVISYVYGFPSCITMQRTKQSI